MSRLDRWLIFGILVLIALLAVGQFLFGGAPWLK